MQFNPIPSNRIENRKQQQNNSRTRLLHAQAAQHIALINQTIVPTWIARFCGFVEILIVKIFSTLHYDSTISSSHLHSSAICSSSLLLFLFHFHFGKMETITRVNRINTIFFALMFVAPKPQMVIIVGNEIHMRIYSSKELFSHLSHQVLLMIMMTIIMAELHFSWKIAYQTFQLCLHIHSSFINLMEFRPQHVLFFGICMVAYNMRLPKFSLPNSIYILLTKQQFNEGKLNFVVYTNL